LLHLIFQSSIALLLGDLFISGLGITVIVKLIDASFIFAILLVRIRKSNYLNGLFLWVCQLSMACVCKFLRRLITILWHFLDETSVMLLLVILISAYPIVGFLSFFMTCCYLILKITCLKQYLFLSKLRLNKALHSINFVQISV